MRRTQAFEEQVLKRPRIEELGCEVEVRRHPGARRLTQRLHLLVAIYIICCTRIASMPLRQRP